MNQNLKLSALKLAVLLVTVGVLATGCIIWRGHDRDESPRHEERESHDANHHDDQEHHEDQDHH